MNTRVASFMLGMMLLITISTCQSFISLNYTAEFGECEIDENQDGIADGWITYHTWGGQPLRDMGVVTAISTSQRFSGFGSQQVTFSRVGGDSGRVYFQYNIIDSVTRPPLIPPEGTPLLIRVRMQTQNLQGVTPRILLYRGDLPVVTIASSISANTSGWQNFSAIVPLVPSSSGELVMHLVIEFACQSGAVTGTAWLDAVECLWMQFPKPQRAHPNGLRIAHHNVPVSHWQVLLDPAVDFLIAPLSHVQALSQYLPNAQLGVYMNAAQTSDRQPTPWNDFYGGYQFVLDRYPHWFLRRNGAPFNNPGYPYLWPVDIGLPEVRAQFVQRFLQIRQRLPLPKWIFLDDTGAYWQCDQYPDLNSNQQAWTGFFSYVIPAIHQQTNRAHRFIMNSGSWAGRFVDGNPGQQWITYLDGVMLEHVLVFYRRNNGGEYIYQPYRYNRATLHMTDSTWWGTLRAINAFPEKVWVIVAMCDANENPSMFRYILASYFIMMHANTYLMVEDRRTAGIGTYHKWLGRPEPWIPLGNPRGSWYTVAGTVNDHTGALFARDFENGIVLVNPTENQTYEYTLPRAYKNWDGQVVPAGTRVSIGPKTGLAFYAAPEIKITISPQQVTAMPGETVTFVVQYRNDGLTDATNVKIRVPLPEGLEFVSSSTGGQYMDRQITWTLSSVRAGQAGTLTFQAKVQ